MNPLEIKEIKLLETKLEELFNNNADPLIAINQKRYMKNQFEFFGLTTAKRRLVQKEWLKSLVSFTEPMLISLMRSLWEKEGREYQYTAMEIAKKYHEQLSINFLPTIEYMIRTKSWWDTVDCIAKDLLGNLLAKNPDLQIVMDQWIIDQNLWIRRSAILYQLSYKHTTNSQQLFDYCKQTMHEKEFFIRKAIGWALRQYSKTNPTAVRNFVEQHEQKLSGLSKREALKYC